MSQEVAAIYSGILEQVMLLENNKKEISKQILINKDKRKRLNLVYQFLSCELNKHELFEQALVIAMNNKENDVIAHLQRMYEPFGDGELIDTIRQEIAYTQRFLQVAEGAKKEFASISFTERRMMQEISKYVIAQCKLYAQL